ncbi:MAG: dTDP-4-dehydrorhamnose 3,5-epimerase family protein [Bdellovibrionales bacterium]|nr:dTDP-4-dehydrorhamnose 3,5-epimerase family protein [Bdellovibrionales bacterium]
MEQATANPGPILVTEFKPFRDARGTFQKIFRADSLAKHGFDGAFRESFISFSEPGVVRGLHFQTPPADHWKLVTCVAGEILDVCVDLRAGRRGKVHTFSLSVENGHSLLLPPGFAHGFATKGEAPAGVLYLTSTEHDPKYDAGIRYDSIDFDWARAVGRREFVVSDRDSKFPKLSEFGSPW